MYINKLNSTLKGTRSIDLSPLTVVTGPNESGKTAVLQSIRLALTGKLPGTPNATSIIEEHGAADGSLSVSITMNDGSAGSTAGMLAPNKGPSKLNRLGILEELDGLAWLPLVNIGDLLGAGDAKLRDAVIARFGAGAGVTSPAYLDASQRTLWDQAAAQAGMEGLTGISGVQRMRKLFETTKRDRNAEVKVLLSKQQSLLVKMADAGSAEDIPVLEAQYAMALRAEGAAATRASLVQAMAALPQAEKDLVDIVKVRKAAELLPLTDNSVKIAELSTQEQASWAAATAANEGAIRASALATVAKRMADVIAAKGHVGCPLCTHDVTDAKTATSTVNDVIRARKAEERAAQDRAQLLQQQIVLLRSEQHAKNTARQNAIDLARGREQSIGARINELRAVINAANDDAAAAAPSESAASIKTRLDKLKSAESTRRQLEDVERDMSKASRESEVAKSLEKVAGEVLDKALASLKSAAETAVTKYLPPSQTGQRVVQLDLSDDCQWRIQGTDGRFHGKASMSGSQRAVLAVALALAWTDAPTTAPRIVLLDADDELRGLDEISLRALMQMFSLCVASKRIDQVVMTWMNKSNVENSGYTIIEANKLGKDAL